ncbi:MAG: hypothetical protein JWM11_976, partial [Planctomycetaceae bacterium]|nr:hypothetical protein [Planctomycetaceae bacterium]
FRYRNDFATFFALELLSGRVILELIFLATETIRADRHILAPKMIMKALDPQGTLLVIGYG